MTFLPEEVLSDAITLMPGDQFVRVRLGAVRDVAATRTGKIRRGHAGIVERIGADGAAHTIEGNTNDAGSPEGDGVYRRGAGRWGGGGGGVRAVGRRS